MSITVGERLGQVLFRKNYASVNGHVSDQVDLDVRMPMKSARLNCSCCMVTQMARQPRAKAVAQVKLESFLAQKALVLSSLVMAPPRCRATGNAAMPLGLGMSGLSIEHLYTLHF